MRLNRLLTHGLLCCAEGDAAPAGGGTTPPAAPSPATPPGPPPANGTADLVKQLAELQAKLAGYEGEAAKRTEAETAKQRQATEKQLAEAKAAAEKASGIARSALVRAQLADLAKPEYARLAPEVQVGDDGDLTKESKEALAKFRKENPALFNAPHVGVTPMSGVGAVGVEHLSADEQVLLARANVDPKRSADRLAKSPLAQFIGYKGGLK